MKLFQKLKHRFPRLFDDFLVIHQIQKGHSIVVQPPELEEWAFLSTPIRKQVLGWQKVLEGQSPYIPEWTLCFLAEQNLSRIRSEIRHHQMKGIELFSEVQHTEVPPRSEGQP